MAYSYNFSLAVHSIAYGSRLLFRLPLCSLVLVKCRD